LNEASQLYYRPLKKISIDESMAAFFGLVNFKQYMPLKPIKFGLKFFSLSDILGYCFSFWMYRGSKSPYDTDTVSIVIDHLKTLPNDKVFYLGTDNYYGSLTLIEKINREFEHIYYISTVRANRPAWLFGPLGKEVKSKTKEVKKLDTNNHAYTYRISPDKKVYAVVIEDNKIANFITNITTPTVIQGKKEKLDLQYIYNHTMQGVDITDKRLQNTIYFHIIKTSGL
jgi:hypothetical protein